MTKKLLIIGLVTVALFTGCKSLKDIAVTTPDLSAIADGSYQGTATVGPVKVIVGVNVQGRAITAIDLIQHRNGLGKKAEVIVPKIIEAQNLEVDSVSGATASSKAILLAVEDALKKDA